ncbi:MAG: hypothetical protein D6795_03655 [Deltaproteobacteria bacterium]|nr:MAG: hypothetical protein D6795_03655 [Deltaproteobacteria bacterium]
MRRVVPLLFLLLFSPHLSLFARETTPNVPFHDLELRFRDSVTGTGVTPAKILIDGVPFRRFTGDRATLTLERGVHTIAIAAPGYRTIEMKGIIGEEAPLPTTVLLDRVALPETVSPARLKAFAGGEKGMAVIAGYVVDDERGIPLPGAEVSLPGTELGMETDDGGFFILGVPVHTFDPKAPPTGTLLVSREGYVPLRRERVALLPGSQKVYRFRLRAGFAPLPEIIDEAEERGNAAAWAFDERLLPIRPEDLEPGEPNEEADAPPLDLAVPTETNATRPTSIRVGMSCSCRSCSSVLVMSMQTYVKHVLPAEWIATWHYNSLRAGAVAVRSYGGWHALHPIDENYDICSNGCCQTYGEATYPSTDAATNITIGQYLLDESWEIARSEYSAENNNTGCGDCYTGTCLYDPVDCGRGANGHGRGMCQWGSQHWATGAENAGWPRFYIWILLHYYKQYGWYLGF